MSQDADAFAETLANARQALLDARTAGGWWEGELSSSALSTATAIFALHLFLDQAEALPPELERQVVDVPTEKVCGRLIADGLSWLALHQNRDGGWGDTIISLSNISTTVLCWAAFAADARSATSAYASVTKAAEGWLANHAGACDPAHLVPAIIARYGKDKTFSVPILTMCALAGRLGQGRAGWRAVPQLPFELAAFPQRWFKWLKLPVVSYALPALIAIGLVRHAKRPSWILPARFIRAAARRRALKLLGRIQPESGGFLEATPLTSFVVMSLAAAGEVAHPVAKNGVTFLIRSARDDGSWPIDTHLATWVTTLAVNALAIDPGFSRMEPTVGRAMPAIASVGGQCPPCIEQTESGGQAGSASRTDSPEMDERETVRSADPTSSAGGGTGLRRAQSSRGTGADLRKIHEWLLAQQYRCEHPYTLADPGAWAWTPLTGGVPDADDTPGALLALRNLGIFDDRTKEAAAIAVKWLLDLQNRNGGIPTFCRGWGNLPFDRSSADLTAHTLRAIAAWIDDLPGGLADRAHAASARAVEFLIDAQHADGSWTPLWFGNQHAPDDINPTYGTARVLLAAAAGHAGAGGAAWSQKLSAAVDWLLAAQRPGGGWGAGHDTPPSIEETAVAVEALADVLRAGLPDASATAPSVPAQPGSRVAVPGDHPLVDLVDYARIRDAVRRGVIWLVDATERGRRFDPSPIGFYFAKLWYLEKLYPLIFTVAALNSARAARVFDTSLSA